MDDCSQFILGWNLKTDMSGRSLEDVVQQTVDFTGMTDVTVQDRRVLLSDNGAGYTSRQIQSVPASGGNQACYCLALPSPDQR